MFSVILSLIWGLLYIRSPYLFPAIVSPLYFLGLHNEVLNVLVTFPMGIFYFANELRNGKQPKYPSVLILEFIRWISVWLFYLLDIFSNAQEYALAGYCYVTLLTILLEMFGKDEKVQLERKYQFYLGWTFWMILWLLFHPINLIVALLLHGLNFMVDFRLEWV